MIRLIVILVILTLVSAVEGWSTQPTFESPLKVDNPSHYQTLVSTSSVPKLFAGCSLAEPGDPEYWRGRPERVFFRQVYLTPSDLSEFGLPYHLHVEIEVDHDTIVASSRFKEQWADYAKCISRFERHSAVRRYLEVVRPRDLTFNGKQFYTDAFRENRMSFHLDSASFYFLQFTHQELVSSVCLFLPELDSMAWFHKFRAEVGVGSVWLENDKVTISQSQDCATCISNVTFLHSNSRLLSLELSADQSWVAFPQVGYARRIVEKHLGGDSLRMCAVGSGNGHAYFLLKRDFVWRDFVGDTWHVRVAIRCQERPRHRDVCFRILPDSSIDRFRVCFDDEGGSR